MFMLLLASFWLAPNGPSATLLSSRSNIDFGDVQTLSHHETTLQLRNTTNRTIRIRGTDADCVCLTSTLSSRSLAPGECLTWTARLNTCDYTGEVRRHIWLETEDPEIPKLAIPVRYRVLPEVYVQPEFVPLGLFGDQPGDVEFTICAWSKEPVRLLATSSTDPRVEVQLKDDVVRVDSPATVRVRINGPFAAEAFSAEVFIETTSADVPRLRIPLFGDAGCIANCEQRELDLGLIPFGAAPKQILSFSLHADVVLAAARTEPAHIDVPNIERTKAGAVLTITSASNLPIGTFRGMLLLETTSNGQTRIIRFPYRGRIIENAPRPVTDELPGRTVTTR